MLTIPWFIIKNFFGKLFKLIFSDWRIVLAVILFIVVGFGYYKWNHLQNELEKKQQQIEFVEKNNAILKENNNVLLDANKQNEAVIAQIKKDQETTLAAVNRLNKDINKSNKGVADLKTKLEGLKTPPTPLTPFISEAVDGIQKLRNESIDVVVTPIPTPAASSATLPAKKLTLSQRRKLIRDKQKVSK
jgi:septal ring factor EnvC (AmiA/AmiB activator)